MLEDEDLSLQSAWLAEHANRAQVVMKTDSYETQYWTVCCGGGLALLPRFRADAEPSLRRITTAPLVPPAAIWLSVHRDNREAPRVRIVLDCIAEAARSRTGLLDPARIAVTRA